MSLPNLFQTIRNIHEQGAHGLQWQTARTKVKATATMQACTNLSVRWPAVLGGVSNDDDEMHDDVLEVG
jgi:hypothetical protein